MHSKIRSFIFSFGVAAFLLFSITASFILYYGLSDNIQPSDVAIILGSKVNPDQTLSPRLVARLEKGRSLYQKGLFKYIIVSGGTGEEGIDEAVAMKNYLIQHHIPAEAIITDSHGDNTRATAKNSALIMKQHNFKRAMVISQYFHIVRARLALSQYGIAPIFNAHADYFDRRDLYSIPREVVAYYKYLLFNSVMEP